MFSLESKGEDEEEKAGVEQTNCDVQGQAEEVPEQVQAARHMTCVYHSDAEWRPVWLRECGHDALGKEAPQSSEAESQEEVRAWSAPVTLVATREAIQ